MTRTFEDKPATMDKVPLLIGLYGSSGSGKTFSALRLATGIQRVTGGEVMLVDTEARRALHYSARFKFRHVEFKPPFSPLDYLAALEHCSSKGAGVVVVDSCSHEWEGPGGVLDMHEQELDRLCGGDAPDWKRERMNFPAWAKPKAEHQRLINGLLQIPCSFILNFRAKEKIKLASKAERDAAKARGEQIDGVKQMGFMPIGDPAFVFEMTLSCLLYPAAGGVPTWGSAEPGERMMTKLPEQFRGLFQKPRPLDEDLGEAMARWAAGGTAADRPALDVPQALERFKAASDQVTLAALAAEVRGVIKRLPKDAQLALAAAKEAAEARLAAPTAPAEQPPFDAPAA